MAHGRLLRRDEVSGREDLGTSPFGVLGNLIWLLLAGWWLFIGHVVTAFGLAITIIGLRFAWAHLKLPALALADRPHDRERRGAGRAGRGA